MVRQLVEGLALEALGLPVTDTNRGVTDTELSGEATPRLPSQQNPGAMRQRILTLLREHPEGLSAEQIRAYLQPERPLGDTLQGMQKAGVVTTHGKGRRKRYLVA